MERIRFQGDANFNNWIVRGLIRRQPLIDFQTGESAHLHAVPDPDVLARVTSMNRILVSHDYHTMPTDFATHLASGRHSPGVLLLHQTLPLAQAIDALLLV